jgi:hypothetical protein
MKNVEQPPPAALFQSRRGRLLHIVKGFFTVKPLSVYVSTKLGMRNFNYKFSKYFQKSGKDLTTQSGFRMTVPGAWRPATAKLMAIRWSS